ncbi:CD209 antigen-like protein A [Danio rerio]|uniref:CD209 antigen-like protein A n=1 Tax=Danio rerio TaxID=7955 RepID=A0AC58G1D6_DANRE
MDSEDIYENVEDSAEPQAEHHNQDKGKYQKCRSRRRVLVLVILGFICALLLLVITLQHISITAERELLKTELMEAYYKPGVFFMSDKRMSWYESRQFCRNHGADLVIIKSEVKQRFISLFVKERVWIGLSDTETEGIMKWVDNSTLKRGFWQKELDGNAGNEDCVELRNTSPALNNWNDLLCSDNRIGVCEKKSCPITWNFTGLDCFH